MRCVRSWMNRNKRILLTALGSSALLAICSLSLLLGVKNGQASFSLDWKLIFLLRLPRLAGALLAGAALAVSGAIVQSVLRSPLASPSLIGINTGSGFFSLMASWLFPASFAAGMIGGFAGGLLSAGLILGLMIWKKPSRLTIVLAGLAISQLFSAGIDLLITLDSDLVSGYASFRIGSLAALNSRSVLRSAWIILPALALSLLCAPQLELFSIDAAQARALGMQLTRWMALLLALAALLAAATVSLCGLIGFAGLIVPAFLRRLSQGSLFYLCSCMLFGALLVAAADLIGRLIALPWELPAGLILSLAGAPFFLYLLLSKENHHAEA